jgi:hypothetical protein
MEDGPGRSQDQGSRAKGIDLDNFGYFNYK